MKKILGVLLSIIMMLLLILVGCDMSTSSKTWIQGKASADIEPYARRAIEIIDGYLSFELTAETATDEFETLYQRIKPYDIRGTDSNYNDPDQRIAYIIDSLAIFDADRRTDVEYHQYRDILAFQIGETVSGKCYDATPLGLDDCPKMIELFNANEMPIKFAVEFETDGVWSWLMTFDEMNGVDISAFQNYIESVYNAFLNSGINSAHITFYYSRYEQNVFSVSLFLDDGNLTGSVRRNDEQAMNANEKFLEEYTINEISEMDGYPSEFAILKPIYEFNSIKQLPDAMAAARSFAGIK